MKLNLIISDEDGVAAEVNGFRVVTVEVDVTTGHLYLPSLVVKLDGADASQLQQRVTDALRSSNGQAHHPGKGEV